MDYTLFLYATFLYDKLAFLCILFCGKYLLGTCYGAFVCPIFQNPEKLSRIFFLGQKMTEWWMNYIRNNLRLTDINDDEGMMMDGACFFPSFLYPVFLFLRCYVFYFCYSFVLSIFCPFLLCFYKWLFCRIK
jgi:hypothetical protein